MSRLALFALLMLSACSTLHSRAVERAVQARDRGDWVSEAFAWKEACEADPADVGSCAAFETAAETVFKRAEAACEEASPDECLQETEQASRLLPMDERIPTWSQRAVEAKCGTASATSVGGKLARLGCVSNLPLSTPAWIGTRRALAEEFIGKAELASTPSASLAWRSAAACLGGRSLDETAQIRAIALPIEVRTAIAGADVPDLCALVSHPGIVCGEGEVFELIGKTRTSARSTKETTREMVYSIGARQFLNPERNVAAQRVLALEQAIYAIELEQALAESACSEARRALFLADFCDDCPQRLDGDRFCAAAASLKTLHGRRTKERALARQALEKAPEFIEEPILETHRYEERLHSWEVEYEGVLRGRSVRGTVVLEDLEHAAFAPAGLEADPFQEPGPGDIGHALASSLLPALEAEVQAWADEAARDRRSACAGSVVWDDAWLGCWAESLHWAGSIADGEELVRGAGVSCVRSRGAGAGHGRASGSHVEHPRSAVPHQ